MVSHVMILGGAVLLRFLVPRLVLACANPNFLSIFSFCLPVLLTITALFEYKKEKRKEEERDKARQTDAPPQNNATSQTARDKTKPKMQRNKSDRSRSRRRSLRRPRKSLESASSVPPPSKVLLEEEMRDWAHFWVVRACLEVFKCLVARMPPQFTSISTQLELLFYVWVYSLPFLQSDAGPAETQPLQAICSFLKPHMDRLIGAVSDAIPLEFWQGKIVGYASKVKDALVLIRLFSQPTADWLLHVLDQSRVLVVPALSLFTPGFLTRYGGIYVQYILPACKSYSSENNNNMEHVVFWLQYWVLNALVDSCLFLFSSILWWIPLSIHATFLFWCYLSMPTSVQTWYHVLELECKNLGLLPGDHDTDIEQTTSFYMLLWIWENIPKAEEEEEQQNNAPPPRDEVRNVVKADKCKSLPKRSKDPPGRRKDPPGRRKEHCGSPSVVAVDTGTTTEDDDDNTDAVRTRGKGGSFEALQEQPPRMMTRASRRRALRSARQAQTIERESFVLRRVPAYCSGTAPATHP